MVMGHMEAGHKTTGTTLAFKIDHLPRNPEQQAKLHKELKGVNLDDFTTVNVLSYLTGVVLEILCSIHPRRPQTLVSCQKEGSRSLINHTLDSHFGACYM